MKTLLIYAAVALLASCASAPPPARQTTVEDRVTDLIGRGKCDDAWFLAMKSGSQPLVDRVDSACHLKAQDVL